MLYEEITTGAVVVGYSVDTGAALTASQAEGLRRKLAELSSQHRVDVQMFIPGDSSTDHADNPEMQLSSSKLYFGVVAVSASPDDAPSPIALEQVRAAEARLKAVPASLWTALSEAIDALPSTFGEGLPSAFLMCWGPLASAVLAYGVKHPSDEKDSAEYEFFSCQDMDQTWLPEGIDGICVPASDDDDGDTRASVEFDSVVRLSLTEALLANLATKVPSQDGPALYLTVRYD